MFRTQHASLGLLLALAASLGGAGLPAAEPAAPRAVVRQVKVLADRAPDCTSLQAIVDSVTRGCRTNDQRGIALYNFMQLTHYHQNYPGEQGGLGALKEINVYGWSLCGGLHSVEAALWRQAGWRWRFVGWSDPGHTTVEAFYDNHWHYFDVFLRFYAWKPDAAAPGGRTIASQADLRADPALVTQGFQLDKSRGVYYQRDNAFENLNGKANWLAPCFLDCGDEPPGILTGIQSSSQAGEPTGWMGIEFDSPGYLTDVDLAPGYSLDLLWDALPGAHWWNGRQYVPGHGCGDKDYRNCPSIGPILEPYHDSGGAKRSYASGRLLFAPDLASADVLASFAASDNVKQQDGQLVAADARRPATVTIALHSPYLITRGSAVAEGAESAEISLDEGKTFAPVELADFSAAIGGHYSAQVRLTFKRSLRTLKVEAIVQHNRCALPYLSPGNNQVTVSVRDPHQLGDNRLVVTYAYQTGERSKSYEELADMGAELARAHGAAWSKTPTVVQKVFRGQDLPASFDIPVPTPQDKFPVYPRMLFLRREVIGPQGQPLPLPAGAVEPRVGPRDKLATLPNPFLVGTAPPPPKATTAVETRVVELQASHAVSADGQVAGNHFLKTKPGEIWALLVGGRLDGLPAARDIRAARLVFPVVRGHGQAATKAAATLLAGPFAANEAFDFRQLGDAIGFVAVPQQPDDRDYSPPKLFTIDVTRALKRLAAGEAQFHGFGLRTVPDRGVDDGYITRLDLPPHAQVRLELEIAAPQQDQ